MADKDDAANELVRHHFELEPELQVVYRIRADGDSSPDAPIRLLEVNAATLSTGSVEVFVFGPSRSIPFAVEIAEITPEELEELRHNPNALPAGWDLSKATVFNRPQAA